MRFDPLGLFALASALQRNAAELARYNAKNDESAAATKEQTLVMERMAEQQRLAIEQHAASMKQTEEWRAIEREHMKVCERRYRLMMDGKDAPETIRH